MTVTNSESGTSIVEVVDGIYRINTPVEIGPGQAFSFSQYLVTADLPLLFHTGPRQLFPLVREAVEHIMPADPLQFDDGRKYPERILAAQQKTGHSEGMEVGRGTLLGRPVAYGLFVFKFMGGSMGSGTGERIPRLFERATAMRIPVLLLHASGGARMQEGILSLMQMAKTVSALRRFREVKQPFISICLHPTTGGVAASTAFLGDINMVEPNALIGFAGPRVIEGTIRQKLPEGFQSSEFLLEHGMIDTIVPRQEMKASLARFLRHLAGPAPVSRRTGPNDRE